MCWKTRKHGFEREGGRATCHSTLSNHRTAISNVEELSVKVSCYSMIAVRCVLYTVPSRLIGRHLTVHLYHDRLVGYVGNQQVDENWLALATVINQESRLKAEGSKQSLLYPGE